MALLLAGVFYQAQEVSLRDKPPAMLALSPKGTVPVLLLPTGEVLEQSLDIMRWAFASTHDVDGWWARAQTSDNQKLLALCDADFKHHLDRYKYPQRYSDALGAEYHASQAVSVLLEPLEAQLKAHAQLGGAKPCAADIAIFPFVRQFAAVDPAWFEALPLPAVKAWLAAWLQSTLFTKTMQKPQKN
jgi:glutathione S-transferase